MARGHWRRHTTESEKMIQAKEITCRAWAAAVSFNDMIDTTHYITVGTGSTQYYFAAPTRGNNVRLERRDTSNGVLKVVRRYVSANKLVVLRPIES